jgi:hypothetical protein
MFPSFSEYFRLLEIGLVDYYGWVFFVWLLIWLFYKIHIIDRQNVYGNSIEWVFLEIKVDILNERSPLAMEQVFAALHAIHTNYTWGEKFDGKVVLWLSCEIVSFGGNVKYIIKIPKRYRPLLESAIFAQYPKAEIKETVDYLANLPHYYVPEEVDFDFWGTQFLKKKDGAYPIRVYESFEHSSQETFIDPLSNVLEVMSNIEPYELLASQIVIRPVNDDWKQHTKHVLDKLKGAPEHHENSVLDKLIFWLPDFIMDVIVTHILGVEKDEHSVEHVKDEPPSQMLHKTEGEKDVIGAIEHAMSKVSYEAKLRLLYIAPKGRFNKGIRVPEVIGSYRNFDDVNLNGTKPDIRHTWTDHPYKINERLEKPYLKYKIITKKRHLWHNFLLRSVWRGTGQTYFNTEELATLYHFPVSPNVRVSQVGQVTTVKSAPPSDLPIG